MTLDQPALESWGERIGRDAAAAGSALFLALRGDLGAGKSVLARAVARGAGVEGVMPSPTFNLLFRYPTPSGAVVHLDLYRLERPEEVWALGWRELGEAGEIVLVEWPERAEALLPPDRWDVELKAASDTERWVRATRQGNAPSLPEPEPGA